MVDPDICFDCGEPVQEKKHFTDFDTGMTLCIDCIHKRVQSGQTKLDPDYEVFRRENK